MKENSIFIILISIILINNIQTQHNNDGLLNLTDENYKEAIQQHKNVLVVFVSQSCSKCDELDPELSKAQKLLNQNNINAKIAKIDGEINSKINSEFNFLAFPQFKYYENGKPKLYLGGREKALDIFNWILKQVQGSTKDIETEQQLKQEIEFQDVVVVLYFGSNDIFEYQKIYSIVAKRYNQAVFLRAKSDSELYEKFNITKTPHLMLFRKSDDSQITFEKEWNARNVERWIVQKSIPDIIQYDTQYVFHVFVHKHPTLFLFRDQRDNRQDQIEHQFIEIAKKLKNEYEQEEILFAITDYTNPDQKKVADQFGFQRKDFPKIALINPQRQHTYKYILNDEEFIDQLQYDTLSDFLQKFLRGDLKRHLKVQDEVDEIILQKYVYQIKGNSSYTNFIQDQNKDKLVLYYAGFCNHCQDFMPTFEQVAEEFYQKYNSTLVFGRIDVTKNEIDKQIHAYPTMYYLKKNQPDQPVKYEGDRSYESVKQFLEFYYKQDVIHEEIQEYQVQKENTVNRRRAQMKTEL